MFDDETRAPQYRFKLKPNQLEAILFDINSAFLDRNRTISPGKNIDPQSKLPVIPNKSYIYVPRINERHCSIYVNNIEISEIDICTIIDTTMTAIILALNSSTVIEAISIRVDNEEPNQSSRSLKSFESDTAAVKSGDELVARELALAYKAITGFKATMGGHKHPKSHDAPNGENCHPISSPFTIFAMGLIEISRLKRLGGGEFSVGIIRDALSGHWKSDEMDGDVRPSPTLVELARKLPKRKPGRRPQGMAMVELDKDLQLHTQDLSDQEIESLAGRNDRWMKFALFAFRRS